MAEISVPVSSPGLGATTDGFNRLGVSAERASGTMVRVSNQTDRLGKSWSSLRTKLGSGEVIRNTAASFALMATQGNGATEKIAGLAGALAAVPGPIGLVAAGVAAAATIFGVFSRAADEAAKKTEALKKELVSLGNQRASMQKSLADAVGGAAKQHGMGLRKAMSMGASSEDISTGLSLTGGNAAEGLGIAGSLGASGMDAEGKKMIVERLKALRAMGVDITQQVLDKAVKDLQYERQSATTDANFDPEAAAKMRAEVRARGGGIFGTEAPRQRETGSAFTSAVLDLAGRDSANNNALLNRFNASQSQAGRGNRLLLDAAEAPAIADTERQFRDAFRATGAVESEALKAATLANTTSTDNLTKAITDLDKQIQTTKSQITDTSTDDANIDAIFKYGRDVSRARR